MRTPMLMLTTVLALGGPAPAVAQTFPTGDPVLRRIWTEGMERSQVERLAQTLMDSIGPRLTGSPGMRAASDWVIRTYADWGIAARAENYGTWRGWRRGLGHLDLIRPRVRALEGDLLAWSPGTPRGRPVEGPVVVLPEVPDSAAFAAWLPSVRGKFVAISFPPPTCRPDEAWERFAGAAGPRRGGFPFGGPTGPTLFERLRQERAAADSAWSRRLAATGYPGRALPGALEHAGALGVLTTNWPQGYGATRVFDARTATVPTFWLGCEDYGLVARLAERNQGPLLRAQADAEFLGEVPNFNTIAEIRGAARPDEYVVLSAHFDSWDGGSGATDNGTGTVIMMEAMRLLRAAYPSPARTVVAGHWNSEEQGLNGSRAFAADHPEVVAGLQALFNQDNGTGLVTTISPLGLLGGADALPRWFARLPTDLTRDLRLDLPGSPSGGGTDHASFICAGAPAVSLGSDSWDYFNYTWHTNRDTFDKVALDNVRRNATLVAMLAYLAASDTARVGRDRRDLPVSPRSGQPQAWPECRDGARTWNR